ncbi:hypothetical protein IFM89_019044 [Coptis chinensis]|uniref:Uncharacterized protein n=1 Tax=Coptis chinensis TaxID=261450 RepID=A0A835IX97_9MAGN|nr:hypothetical protein IFM89_019044 [Coptis chinensis]
MWIKERSSRSTVARTQYLKRRLDKWQTWDTKRDHGERLERMERLEKESGYGIYRETPGKREKRRERENTRVIYLPEGTLKHQIMEVEVNNLLEEDRVVWSLSHTGEFSTKAAYEAISLRRKKPGTQGSKAKSFGVRFNSGNSFKSFSGLKAESSDWTPLANIMKTMVEFVADNCPNAFIHIIAKNPTNSTKTNCCGNTQAKGLSSVKWGGNRDTFGCPRVDQYEAKARSSQAELKSSIEMGVAFGARSAAPTSV